MEVFLPVTSTLVVSQQASLLGSKAKWVGFLKVNLKGIWTCAVYGEEDKLSILKILRTPQPSRRSR